MAHDALAMIHYRDDPAVLLFATGEKAVEAGRRAVEEAGCRVADVHPIAGAVDRLDRQAWADAVHVEAGAGDAGLADLLDRLQAAAACGEFTSVVSVPFELVDLDFAHAPHPDVQLLCDPTGAERRAAVAKASEPRLPRLHDVGKGESAVLLHQMSEQMGKMANLLAELSEEEGAPAKPEGGGDKGQKLEAGQVRAIIRARRLRDQYLPADLFADPAWDMLLDLMAARLEGHRVAVSSLCIAAAVPATTALRWIKMLTDQGLVVRSADPQDGRRVYIELADEAARALTAYLVAAQRISSLGL
jgi:DNA-binding transcriptional ArsR family regulator